MTQGPQVLERRPRARRRCLACGKVFPTVIAIRLCKACAVRAAALAGGVDECAVPLSERGRVKRLPTP